MKFNKDSFTYGIEVEGYFTKELIAKLEDNFSLSKKTDGSVHINNSDIKCVANEIAQINGESGDIISEVNIGVFYQFDKMVKCLEMIDTKNHFQNESCGLHLHIKPKTKAQELRGLIGDFPFIEKLQKFGFTKLCKCVRNREDNQYCEPYEGNDMRYDWRHQEKYRFVRNHPAGTFEFRFLAPCKHKVENVQKFLKYFFTELKRVKSTINSVTELSQYLPEKMLYNYPLENLKDERKYPKYKIEDVLKVERGTESYRQRIYNQRLNIRHRRDIQSESYRRMLESFR